MDDTAMMREALRLAQEAADDGEVPVGCVVAMEDGRIVGRGRNRREKGKSALAHAELEATYCFHLYTSHQAIRQETLHRQ